MRWHAPGLFLALLPARRLGGLLAARTPLPTEFVGAAVYTSLVTGLFLLVSPTSRAVRFGSLGWGELGMGVAVGLMLFLGGAAGYLASEQILGLARPEAPSTFGSIRGPLEIGTVAAALLAVVLAEEVAFRGVLLEAFRRETGAVPAAVASAVSFAAYHLSAYQTLSTLVYGLVLAAVTLWTGGLWTAVIGHLTLNVLGVALSVLAGNGGTGT